MQEKVRAVKLTYSVPEAAEALGVSTTKMYQLIKMDGFPVVALGKRRLISIEGLRRWVEKQAGI